LGNRLAALVRIGEIREAQAMLAPVLGQRTPFRLLTILGEAVGDNPPPLVDKFLDLIAPEKTEGGWVVLAGALARQRQDDPGRAFARCRDFIVTADVWYATDIFGERVPGPALVADFAPSLELLSPWRQDADRWVRRTVGVSVHFWAKRSLGAARLTDRARALLVFLEPMFGEGDLDAVKGLGWGLKTLGRHYPGLLTDWLIRQLVRGRRPRRALLLRKALTFLAEEQRTGIRAAGAP